jgi:uncharacterized delta-60 repeat protein
MAVALMAVVGSLSPALADAAPGELDPSFGGGTGSVATFYGHVNASAVAIQPDGKIVVVGSNSANGMLLSRYNQNGSLDTSFGGGDGQVTAAAAGTAIYLEPNGKILVGGTEEQQGGQWHAVVSRFNGNGSIDTTYGGGTGVVRTNFGTHEDRPYIATFGPDGKLYLAGAKLGEAPGGFPTEEVDLAAYNSDGSLDTAFDGSAGIIRTSFDGGGDSSAFAVAVESNGKVLIGGVNTANYALARYDTNGSLDPTFGNGGEVTTSPGGSNGGVIYTLALQPDGKIVAAGELGPAVALLRYDASGSLDPSFGTGGINYLDPERDFGAEMETGVSSYDLALEPDGRILMSGGLYNYYDNTFATLVARFESNGVLDHGFSSDGVATTPAGGFGAALQDLVLEPDGNILAVGGTGGTSSEYLVQRYLGGGELTSDEPPADEPGATGGGTTPVGGSSPAPAASSSVSGVAVLAVPQPSARKPKRLICRKGFRKQKVHGTTKCVKVKRKRHRR